MNTDLLRREHSEISPHAERLRQFMAEQLSKLLSDAQITLGIPMESRVKEWSSILEKIERKSLIVEDIRSLPDLIGIRTILLFRADLDQVDKVIHETFDVLSSEDTAKRLGEAQFGYQSQHYLLRLPKSWLDVPNVADLGNLQVEVQVRTLAQHVWAAASHKLQYKHEASVPPPLRRTINRVSALLETVDLEFDRVLSERKSYQKTLIDAANGSESLNVDILASMLAEEFPPENRVYDEDYETLLSDLSSLSVNTFGDWKRLLDKHRDSAIAADKEQVRLRSANQSYHGTSRERINSGVFFTHTGLSREVLTAEFGNKAVRVILARKRRK